MTLDGILGRFEKVKTDLKSFVTMTENDNKALLRDNDALVVKINNNNAARAFNKKEIKRANRALKQITKLTGGDK